MFKITFFQRDKTAVVTVAKYGWKVAGDKALSNMVERELYGAHGKYGHPITQLALPEDLVTAAQEIEWRFDGYTVDGEVTGDTIPKGVVS